MKKYVSSLTALLSPTQSIAKECTCGAARIEPEQPQRYSLQPHYAEARASKRCVGAMNIVSGTLSSYKGHVIVLSNNFLDGS
jgi:hypothetical protein